MGAQNFNFDPTFLQNKSFSASKFAFSDSPKFRGVGVPPTTTPLIALKYEAAPLPFVPLSGIASMHLASLCLSPEAVAVNRCLAGRTDCPGFFLGLRWRPIELTERHHNETPR